MNKRQKLAKIQDSSFKKSSSQNKETSICINGVFDIFSYTIGNHVIRIYKSDFVKALGTIALSLPLYTFKNGVATVSDPSEVYDKLKSEIDNKFGTSDTALLNCHTIDRSLSGTNNKAQYLYSNEPFQIRDFLVAFRSVLTFIEDNGDITIRIDTGFDDLTDADLTAAPPVDPPREVFQRIYMGAPGTGKTTEAKAFVKNKIKASPEDTFRTTFHPATDYASFVGCYKPESYDDPSTKGKSLIKYEYCPQPFIQAYTRAWSYKYIGKSTPVVLVIEEINRANCAQAFGDVFQMLDRTEASAITPEKSLKDYLDIHHPYALDRDGKMNLPDNLSILATMNTSDQSLFPIDSAFLRRWERIYVSINYAGATAKGKTPAIDPADLGNSANLVMTFGGKSYKWIDFLSKVNEKISAVQQDEKKMGNYVIKENISSERFIGSILSYLWDAVCKDLDTEDDRYFLRDGDDNDAVFKFWDVVDATNKDALLQGFMVHLDVPEIPTPVLAGIPALSHLVPSAPANVGQATTI